jgi:hypothetical protein
MGQPLLDQTRLRETLTAVLDHAMPACARIDYRLVGTGAAMLRGVQLPARDIDILVKERGDVVALGSVLTSFKCISAPSWLSEGRQYYANYEVNGVEVGISTVEVETDSDTNETLGRGPWEHFSLIPCGPYAVPTVSLELRLITELFRNRLDRSGPIIRYMRLNGCDIALVRRGMEAGRLPRALCEDVLNQLGGIPDAR